METRLRLNDIIVDDINAISERLKERKDMVLRSMAYEDEEKEIGIWIEDPDESVACTIMITLKKEEAVFFAKGILALAETIT